MIWIPWGLVGLFALVAFYFYRLMMYGQRVRVALTAFATLLLLEEKVRDNHREALNEWLTTTGDVAGLALGQLGDRVVEQMARQMAEEADSVLAATAALNAAKDPAADVNP